MTNIRLFCIPYAGGSSSTYYRWKDHVDKRIELIPIELSGRGRRFEEPHYSSIEDAVEDMYKSIHSFNDDKPYAIWGHSMGAVIAYELAHLLQKRKRIMPHHLFCSGTSAPDLRVREKQIHNLPDNEFLEEIQKLEGTPNEFFDNQDLVDLYTPILRNDFKIVEQYRFQEKEAPLQTNLNVLYGDEESFKDQVRGWERHTNYLCRFYEFQGKHFFIFEHVKSIAKIINESLLNGQSEFRTLRGANLHDN